jgi:hypothetical protein
MSNQDVHRADGYLHFRQGHLHFGNGMFVVAFYQQSMFVREWYEDHAPAGSWAKRGLLSTEAIFYPSLSQRCRRRRRQLVTALGGAFLWVPIASFSRTSRRMNL